MLQPQVVPMGDTVFVGGGLGKDCMLNIYAYSISKDAWRTMVKSNTILFGMCIFRGGLLTVGGGCEDGLTGKVYTLREREKEMDWDEVLPPMQTERFSLSVFTDNKSTIAACGGGTWTVGDDTPHASSIVEVYSGDSNSWSQARPLPRPCAAMSSTTFRNTCYMFGNVTPDENQGPIYAKLSDITNPNRENSPKPEAEKNGFGNSDWHNIAPPPFINTSVVAADSYLLAIGGCDDKNPTRSVHIYLKESQQWWRLAGGELPQPLEGCGTAVLESHEEIIVVGGEDPYGMDMDTVFVGNML